MTGETLLFLEDNVLRGLTTLPGVDFPALVPFAMIVGTRVHIYVGIAGLTKSVFASPSFTVRKSLQIQGV